MKTLVFLVGPPAVGKMTVGLALQERTGLRLFHNHLSIEAVLPVFEFGSAPFNRLVDEFRVRVFEEAAQSSLPGLIFTYVWAFDEPADLRFVERMKAIFESRGGRTVFVELWSDLQTRVERNETEIRLSMKPSKRNIEQSRSRLLGLEGKYRLNSSGDFPLPDHLWIDNSQMQPDAVAELVADHFSLHRRGGDEGAGHSGEDNGVDIP
jgi:hypothetical protein